jgi:PAS domain-containing protein
MENSLFFQAILDSISEGMTLDKDWRVASWNRAAEKITDSARKFSANSA